MKAREFLKAEINRESQKYFFGETPKTDFVDSVVDAWMDDEHNSAHRFDVIKDKLPSANKILDMASGCGTFVYYGLLNGFNVHGIDPEEWKHTFHALKAAEKDYPKAWSDHFRKGVGENLPYDANAFDCVSSYQTLEHVQDVEKCLSEMIRVTRPGGGLHIMCPDYRSTYEAHYLLPWLPFFPRKLAMLYLRLMNRPIAGLSTINYVTAASIKRHLRKITGLSAKEVTIVDLNRERFDAALMRRHLLILKPLYFVYRSYQYLSGLFRREIQINLFVFIS
jgi:ubiquinone/menaquinone biosynthesis C-methylase UbiE